MATLGETTRPGFVYDSASDTWIPVGIGPHSHTPAAIGAISSSVVTTKGDLIVATGSGTVVRQGVGADGSMLVADSSQADGINYALGNAFAAGKNKIINGDMGIWQRGTSFAIGNGTTYSCDRYKTYRDGSGATVTVSRQTFATGTAPVAGYESAYFLRFNQSVAGTGTTYSALAQSIEDIRTFAGQTVTFSFWAKADANRNFNFSVQQEFGQGGSSAVYPGGGIAAVTTSWQRFSFTVNVPSITGKTIGTGSYLQMYFDMPLNTVFTFDTWGWQAEAGSVATPFQTASGSIGGELALCQRYYTTSIPTGFTITDFSGMNPGSSSAIGWCSPGSSNDIFTTIQYPVPMRSTPTFNIYSAGNRTSGSVRDAVTGADLAVSNYSVQTGNNKGFNYMSGFTATTGRPYSFQWTASAEL